MVIRILIADGDPTTLLALSAALRRQCPGYIIETAQFGQQALYMLSTRMFHLLLTDLQMPGLDGLHLLQAIRARSLDIPVLLMSGFLDEELCARALRLGARALLQKPLTLEELTRHVSEALGRSRALGRTEGGTGRQIRIRRDRAQRNDQERGGGEDPGPEGQRADPH